MGIGRRTFLGRIAAGAAWIASGGCGTPHPRGADRAEEAAGCAAPGPGCVTGEVHGTDAVALGRTGITASRLAIGTGTHGGREQRALGVRGLADLLRFAYDQGVCFFDTADRYGTHPHVAAALEGLPRERIVVTSKIKARDAKEARRAIDRIRSELATDWIDIVLLHALRHPGWSKTLRGAMDGLAEAKARGRIRAHGISSHHIGALEEAAASPWVDVILARVNHKGENMDGPPAKVTPILRRAIAAGKGVYAMKVLGEGKIAAERDASLAFLLGERCAHAFVIGFSRRDQIRDILGRIPLAGHRTRGKAIAAS